MWAASRCARGRGWHSSLDGQQRPCAAGAGRLIAACQQHINMLQVLRHAGIVKTAPAWPGCWHATVQLLLDSQSHMAHSDTV
jgi:hypothetical protein